MTQPRKVCVGKRGAAAGPQKRRRALGMRMLFRSTTTACHRSECRQSASIIMGRLTQAHFDDLFLNKVKQVCVHVLDQLNEANEIEQAFDLCPSISRRNRVILSFLHDAGQVDAAAAATSSASPAARSAASSASPPLASVRPSSSALPSRQASLGTDSVASLSAQRRRRAREMQYVRDPIDSEDDSDSRTAPGPSSISNNRLDPASARNPSMSQPDYTFEQFTEHLDPTDKLLKRSFEIIIKETARQALAKNRNSDHDPARASSRPSHDSAASLRSAIASSRSDRNTLSDRARTDIALARRMARALGPDSDVRGPNASAMNPDPTNDLLRSIAPPTRALSNRSSANGQLSLSSSNAPQRTARLSLREFLLPSTDSERALSWPTSTTSTANHSQARRAPPFSVESQRSAPPRPSTSVMSARSISARLAEASRRNAEAARTIDEAERLRSSQFIRTSIESLRASLFQFHIDLASTQLQNAHNHHVDQIQQSNSDDSAASGIGSSYALVMDTIELFDDTLRRLSCLVSNNDRDDRRVAEAQTQVSNTERNTDSSQMRTSLWRARNLLLLSSMSRRSQHAAETSAGASTSSTSNVDVELKAHHHLMATIEESHWARPDVVPPSGEAIRTWRRKVAAWYHLDRDRTQYPDARHTASEPEEGYARWHPDVELAYPLDDEIHEPSAGAGTSSRPDPIADPRAAWASARQEDASLSGDLNDDPEIRAALDSDAVNTARSRLCTILAETGSEPARQPVAAAGEPVAADGEGATADDAHSEADPDVSLTRTTSLTRRNAVRGLPLSNSDAGSIRSARTTLSLGRARNADLPTSTARRTRTEIAMTADGDGDELDAGEEDSVETSMEIGTATRLPTGEDTVESLAPPADRPRAGRSGSFTFITTPAAVLRSRQRSQSRSQAEQRSASPASDGPDEDEVLEGDDSEAEEYIDLDLDLGMAGEDGFDFDLVDFLRTESRRAARAHDDDDSLDVETADSRLRRRFFSRVRGNRNRDAGDGSSGSQDEDEEDGEAASGIRVFVSGSGASTPAEARQATFEAYAQRARLLERRRRLEVQPAQDEDDADHSDRRRRTARSSSNSDAHPRNSLPFPRTSER